MHELIQYSRGVWFGPAEASLSRSQLVGQLRDATIRTDRAVAAIELLKLGDFSAARELLNSMQAETPVVRAVCCAVFCSVAKHDEIQLLMEVLSESDEHDVEALALYSVHTLSLHMIPYLLALLQTWEGTWLEPKLMNALRGLCPVDNVSDGSAEDIGRAYRDLTARMDPAGYYLWGKPVFAGDLTKALIRGVTAAKQEGRELRMFEVPMLLSVWSGIECPVGYSSAIDEAALGAVLGYVKRVARIEWRKGAKYFYGHRIG